jgi:PHD/YefM family antitoxin component YafN of YafNO toxin-antitoxin module
MMAAKEQYLVDEHGKRTAVLLDVEYYRELLAAVEEIESIRAYDEAKACDDDVIPFSQATEEIERHRQ